MKAGEHVALVEPRGMGEGAPDAKPGAFGPDLREAFLALHLDRPLLGQRVFDLLQALRGLDNSKSPVHLVGIGAGGPIVLHAAALVEGFASVTVERSVPSWSMIARMKSPKGDLASVIPGVLMSYDLPDLAAALAPSRLTIREPLDPAGGTVAQPALDAAYARCRAAYEAIGAKDELTLKAGR